MRYLCYNFNSSLVLKQGHEWVITTQKTLIIEEDFSIDRISLITSLTHNP